MITEFLAGIGFEVDKKSMAVALKQAASFGAAIGAATTAAIAGLVKIAESEASLGEQAQKLALPVEKLEALRFAAEQAGAGADALDSSLQGLKKANPAIQDTGLLLEKAASKIKGMSDAAAEAYAAKMGIDTSLIPMLRQDLSGLEKDYMELYAASGRNAAKSAADAKALLGEFGKLKSVADLVVKSVAGAFLGKARESITLLRKFVMENFQKIRSVFETVIGVVLRMGDILFAFIYRIGKFAGAIIGWFNSLDDGQKKVVIGLGLILAAWKLLNAGFLATPFGMIIGALTAIILLVDDYLGWKEGADSAFDWSEHARTIEAVVDILKVLWKVVCAIGNGISSAIRPAIEVFKNLFATVANIVKGIVSLVTKLFQGDIAGVIESGKEIWNAYKEGVINTFLSLVNTIAAFFTGMWASVTQSFPDFAEWATSAANSIRSIFGKAVGWLKDKLRSITKYLPDWVKEKMGLGDMPEDEPGKEEIKENRLNPASGQNKDKPVNIPEAPPNIPNIRPVPAGAMLRPSPMATQQAINNKSEIKVDAKTQITVNGTQSPEAVAAKVGAAQNGFAADIARNTRGAVR